MSVLTPFALGFKQLRTIRIITEETHYSQRRKVRVLTIDRPLEGEIKVSHSSPQQCLILLLFIDHSLVALGGRRHIRYTCLA